MSSLFDESFFKISDSHKYFAQRQNRLRFLLKECKNRSELRLTTELLLRMLNIDDDRLYDAYCAISRYLAPKVVDHDWVCSALTHDSSADSSQAMLDEIKVVFQELKLRPSDLINRIDYLWTKKKWAKYKDINTLVLLDNFLGSGQTLKNRLKDLKVTYSGKCSHFTKIIVVYVAGMTEGINRVKEAYPDVEIYVHYPLQKGISESYPQMEALTHIQTMLQMEERLSSIQGEKELATYSMGYGEMESLVSFCQRNIPNNVFPLFWWPARSDGSERTPLFTRYEKGI